eukprot:5271359-Pleurochrysis_carterae.AAC.1
MRRVALVAGLGVSSCAQGRLGGCHGCHLLPQLTQLVAQGGQVLIGGNGLGAHGLAFHQCGWRSCPPSCPRFRSWSRHQCRPGQSRRARHSGQSC